eukprot:Hpha_TRINITY_DN7744_c0_g1::TRINITY_DN7744_c0_g1_i2::g.85542::m.85542
MASRCQRMLRTLPSFETAERQRQLTRVVQHRCSSAVARTRALEDAAAAAEGLLSGEQRAMPHLPDDSSADLVRKVGSENPVVALRTRLGRLGDALSADISQTVSSGLNGESRGGSAAVRVLQEAAYCIDKLPSREEEAGKLEAALEAHNTAVSQLELQYQKVCQLQGRIRSLHHQTTACLIDQR